MSESTAETRETVYTDLVIEKDMKGKQFRSHSVFDRTTLSLKRLKEMKTSWDNEESDQRKSLSKMLENLQELIKEQEENESKATRARRLSALDTSGMSKVVCDKIGFQNNQEKGNYLVEGVLETDKLNIDEEIRIKEESNNQRVEVNHRFHILFAFHFIFKANIHFPFKECDIFSYPDSNLEAKPIDININQQVEVKTLAKASNIPSEPIIAIKQRFFNQKSPKKKQRNVSFSYLRNLVDMRVV